MARLLAGVALAVAVVGCCASLSEGTGGDGAVVWPDYQPISGRTGYFSSIGNHRFNVSVTAAATEAGAPPVVASVAWRRSDAHPLAKAVYVTSSANSTTPIPCTFVGQPTADSATVSFTAVPGATQYFIYYMPFSTCEYAGGACVYGAQVTYDPAGTHGSCENSISSLDADATAAPLQGVYQARAPFESFEPMEMPMTVLEATAWLNARSTQPLIVVPEVREHVVKMRTSLPSRWVDLPSETPLRGTAQPGEHYSFQLAVVNMNSGRTVVAPMVVSDVTFSDLTMQGKSIPASAMACMNMQGSDFWGRDFVVDHVLVPAGEVKPLWVKLVIPSDADAGTWSGVAKVTAAGNTVAIPLHLTIQGQPLQNGGDDDIERGTRIHWFDSKLAIAGDTVPSPFVSIAAAPSSAGDGLEVQMLAKAFSIGPSGLPKQLLVTTDTLASPPLAAPRKVLGDDMAFEVDGLAFSTPKFTAGTASNMSVSWTSVATDSTGAASLNVAGSVDCTGYALLNITLSAKSALANAGVRLRLPSNPETAFFAMGLGTPGGFARSWIGEDQSHTNLASWLVFDFQRSVTLDGFRLYSHGDGVHDVTKHYLQAASMGSTPGGIGWAAVVGRFTGKKGVTQPQDYTFKPSTARIWRWVITDVVPSSLCPPPHCQPDVAEVEFREAGKAFAVNTGTAKSSLVIGSSGGDTPENPGWKAVDGKLIYVDYKEGWDAGMVAGPPDAPQPPAPPLVYNKTWTWDGQNGNNAIWFGSTKAGVRLELKGEDPLWWAGSPYDSGSSPDPPDSWANSKQGGIQAFANGTAVAFSGPRAMTAGQSISYVFSLMVTPVRPFDIKERFQERWAQLGGPTNYSQLAAAGVTVVNMHQGNEINPWINYPYLTNAAMKYAADACHKLGMQYSVYNTMRELSDRCTEYFPMLSFNETLVPGAGGGADWLQEHIRTGYLPAWSNPVPPVLDTSTVPNPDPLEGLRLQDAGMRVKALSRWNNYYVAGCNLSQFSQNLLYGSCIWMEIAYDRITMLRARKVLGDRGRIDHHADHGFVSQSPVVNYMELYPFINRLWYGEGFDYNTPSADYWLIEIAGLETGLSADMLRYPTMQHSHGMTRYHYRGMLVASSFRYSGAGPFDPTALWRLWDDFGIETSQMIGWWSAIEEGNNTVPVRCAEDNSEVKVTTFVKHGEAAMIVVADWNEAALSVDCTLSYNWSALGLNQATAKLHAPELPPFQLGSVVRDYHVGETISINVTAGGLLLVLE